LPSVDEPRRHQVVEIPEITYLVSEYVQHGVICPDCDTTTYASLPHGVSPSSFGPNLRAFIGLLSGRYRTSRREVTELVHDVLGISISVGAVDNTCRRISEALEEPVKEVAERVKEAPVAHMDETGWRQKGQRMWLWVVVTTYAVLFRIGTRSKGEAIDLLGSDFRGKLVSDRYAVYYQFNADRRQVCWAHLSRDFRGVMDRGGAGCRIGQEALAIKDELFRIWHRYMSVSTIIEGVAFTIIEGIGCCVVAGEAEAPTVIPERVDAAAPYGALKSKTGALPQTPRLLRHGSGVR